MQKISKDYIIFDCEVFPNWWCIVFSTLDKQKTIFTSDSTDYLLPLYRIIDNYILTGFNIKNYDMKILDAILNNYSPERLYKLSKNIISEISDPLNSINFWNKYLFTDLFDDWKNGSLKEYESNKGLSIKESSISFDSLLKTDEEKLEIIQYCCHDVDATISLFNDRSAYIAGKLELASMFNINPYKALKSTNAKLASILLEAKKINRETCEEYTIPEKVEKYIKNNLPKDILESFEILNYDEKEFTLYHNNIKFGIGGIHSTYSDDLKTKSDINYQLINIDVTSYYPNLLMNFNYMSRNVSKPELYKDLYNLRVKLKHDCEIEKQKNGLSTKYYELYYAQQALKLVLNTVYGAMKNQYNDLYDPYMAGCLCYTGQLLLAALANELYMNILGLKVIQTNTDGILVKCPKTQIEAMKKIVSKWESLVGFSMEYDYISAFFQANVNNYIEVTGNPKDPFKLKGKWSNQAFIDRVETNLNAPITHKALLQYYVYDIPIEDTINSCTDVKEFCFTTKTGRTYQETYYELDNKLIKVNKVNRVIATTDKNKGTIYKYKPDTENEPKKTDYILNSQYIKALNNYTKKKNLFEEKYNIPYGRLDKIAEIPMNCEIVNDELNSLPSNIDKQWYIDFCKNKLKELIDV